MKCVTFACMSTEINMTVTAVRLLFTVYDLHLRSRIFFQLSSLRRPIYTLHGRWQCNTFKMATITFASAEHKIMVSQQLTSKIQVVEYGRIALLLVLADVDRQLYFEISNASVMTSRRPLSHRIQQHCKHRLGGQSHS
jgi:hypothetical protein